MNTVVMKFLLPLLCLFVCSCGRQGELPPLASGDVILAFGNSLTYGTGAKENESYPAVLQSLSGIEVINAGVPGEVSQNGLNRLPAFLDEYRPALLILCHGGNDILRKQSLDTAADNIKAMIQLARDKDTAVILLGVPKFGLILSAAEIYPTIAKETGVVYMDDLIPDILSDNALKSDTVHPNKNGYRLMAEEIYELLQDYDVI